MVDVDAHRSPNMIERESDSSNDSDSTLRGDELVEERGEGVAPSVIEASKTRRQDMTQAATFQELQLYTQNGNNFQVGRTIQGQEGNFLVIASIRQHQDSGAVVIEGFQDSHQRLQTYSHDGRTLKPGKTVEVADGTFLRITAILKDRRTAQISLTGFRFERAVSLDGLLEFKGNEVAMISKLDKNDRRDILEQSTEVVQLADVIRIRELVKTNQQFPSLSFRETDPESQRLSKNYIRNHGRLVCRWNYMKMNKNDGFLTMVTEAESDEGCSVPQRCLRERYRGSTIKGGDCAGWLDTEEAFDRKERMRCFFVDPLNFHPRSTDVLNNRRHQRRYTFGDGFCGCGGASRGAYGAGLRVEWGFDHDPHAIATYYANFPHARCEGIAANDFVTAIHEEYKVDILHLSPPCQTFSPAKTRPGPNDESNEATFLAIEELLKKARPRIVTLEETFGLTRTLDNLTWFSAMIQMFTKLGFSVRWKVFNMQEFGLPQPRRRLLLFASW